MRPLPPRFQIWIFQARGDAFEKPLKNKEYFCEQLTNTSYQSFCLFIMRLLLLVLSDSADFIFKSDFILYTCRGS